MIIFTFLQSLSAIKTKPLEFWRLHPKIKKVSLEENVWRYFIKLWSLTHDPGYRGKSLILRSVNFSSGSTSEQMENCPEFFLSFKFWIIQKLSFTTEKWLRKARYQQNHSINHFPSSCYSQPCFIAFTQLAARLTSSVKNLFGNGLICYLAYL